MNQIIFFLYKTKHTSPTKTILLTAYRVLALLCNFSITTTMTHVKYIS